MYKLPKQSIVFRQMHAYVGRGRTHARTHAQSAATLLEIRSCGNATT